MKVLTTIETIDILNKKIDRDKQFAFVRFGDGEIMLMDGWNGEEGNHFYSPKLAKELEKAFKIKDENYLIALNCGTENEEGMRSGVFEAFKNDENLISIIKKHSDREVYLQANALPYLALFKLDLFKTFWDKIKSKKVMVVGGEHLKDLGVRHFIETPSKQAYYSLEKFYSKITEKINDTEVILLSAGPCSTIIQMRLWEDGREVITLDTGSLLDGVLGLENRQWIKEEKERVKNLKQYAI